MIVYAVIMTVVAVICVGILALYRRQIKIICRHTAFIREKNSNMIITTSLGFKELVAVADEINESIALHKKIEQEVMLGQNSLKTTITNLSHDIRTPLTSLDGYFQLLADSQTQEDKQKYLKIITKRIDSLTDMLEELFTYAKLQDNEYELEMGKTNISQLLMESAFGFYEDLTAAGISPQIDVIETPEFIWGNESAVRRVFQNLLKNALIHGSQGEQKHISIVMMNEQGIISIEIANSFKPDEDFDVDMVFDRFYKMDKSRGKISAGLGLYIAKELVKAMDGEISANIKDGNFCIDMRFKSL